MSGALALPVGTGTLPDGSIEQILLEDEPVVPV